MKIATNLDPSTPNSLPPTPLITLYLQPFTFYDLANIEKYFSFLIHKYLIYPLGALVLVTSIFQLDPPTCGAILIPKH